MSTITTVGVVGLGTMGAGIVEVFAKHGFTVVAMDADAAGVERGRSIITASTGKAVAKEKMTAEEQAALLGRISWHVGLDDASAAQLIVEAAFEDPGVKQQIFAALEKSAPDAILATNTSSLSVTAIAETVADPSRVIGMHFFNPAPVQKLVEVISTKHTSPATVEAVKQVLATLGKTAIYLSDRAGFVVNALLINYLNRAVDLYHDGFCTREEMDEALVAAGNPMGPLTLADLIGNDVNLAIMERMYAATKDPVHKPSPLLVRVNRDGQLGRKTGAGFYRYDGAGDLPLVVQPAVSRADELPLALLAPYLNDACRMVEEGYASEEDINTGMALGCRMPKPFEQLDELGAEAVLAAVEKVHAETGYASHAPSAYLLQKAGR